MTENDCRILARACGVCWHELEPPPQNAGFIRQYEGYLALKCKVCGEYVDDRHKNPTFDSPGEWELVRQEVIEENRGAFCEYIICDFIKDDAITATRWFLTQAAKDLCQHAANFIKSRPDLFPWVTDFLREKEGK